MSRLTRTTLLLVVAIFATGVSTIDAKDKPLRVYILVGQSNMFGTGVDSTLD